MILLGFMPVFLGMMASWLANLFHLNEVAGA